MFCCFGYTDSLSILILFQNHCEIFQIQNTVTQNIFSKVPDYPVRVNDFWIEYDNKSSPHYKTQYKELNWNNGNSYYSRMKRQIIESKSDFSNQTTTSSIAKYLKDGSMNYN